MRPQSHYVICCERELHIEEWNPNAPHTLILWHGLARTGRDFDSLAAQLAADYRLLVPDTLGRGRSQWATDPLREYTAAFYLQQVAELLAHFGIERCGWLGTSMGGLLGMVLAATTLADRLDGLVLNDIGPELPRDALQRIGRYVANPPQFETFSELQQYFQGVYEPFGALDKEEWHALAVASARRTDDGKWTPHYDPRIAEPLADAPAGGHLWEMYDQIQCRTLLIRGENSDLLTTDVAQQMTERGPQAQLWVIPDCGHAPYLNTQEQIELIKAFWAGVYKV
jgi:pimeloyl-ACP methyl ester carboxylesterase